VNEIRKGVFMKRIIVLLSLMLTVISGFNVMAETNEDSPKLKVRETQGVVSQIGNWAAVTPEGGEAYQILDKTRQGELRALRGKSVKIKGTWGVSKQGKYLKNIQSIEEIIDSNSKRKDDVESDF
jgi:hypothetical protein